MLFCQGHGRIESDYRELPGNLQDGLNDRFAYFWLEKVDLGGVIPGHRCTIIAMIYILLLPTPAIDAFEDNRCIGIIIIMIFNEKADALIPGEIRPIKRIGWERAVVQADEPIWMLDYPT